MFEVGTHNISNDTVKICRYMICLGMLHILSLDVRMSVRWLTDFIIIITNRTAWKYIDKIEEKKKSIFSEPQPVGLFIWRHLKILCKKMQFIYGTLDV